MPKISGSRPLQVATSVPTAWLYHIKYQMPEIAVFLIYMRMGVLFSLKNRGFLTFQVVRSLLFLSFFLSFFIFIFIFFKF